MGWISLVALLPWMLQLVSPALFVSAHGTTASGRIDTHIHAVPDAYRAALEAAGIKDTPSWSLEATGQFMNAVNISFAVLSISTPGVSVAGTGSAARQLARTLNTQLGQLATNSSLSQRLGFFGVLPDWQDVEGTLDEIDYLYANQKLCNGVTAYTSYGNKLLGDPTYKPIWQKLQHYKALVFIHPNGLNVTPNLIGGVLPGYVVDFLWSTTRAAVDLVVTGTMAANPDIDIILAHAGGAVPYVGTRALEALLVPQIAALTAVNYTGAKVDFSRFYHDLALSTSPAQLDGLLDFAGPSRIVFGTDFPYATVDLVSAVMGQLAGYQASTDPRGTKLSSSVLKQNALGLLKSHAQRRISL